MFEMVNSELTGGTWQEEVPSPSRCCHPPARLDPLSSRDDPSPPTSSLEEGPDQNRHHLVVSDNPPVPTSHADPQMNADVVSEVGVGDNDIQQRK
ncbi:hypothetical protein MRB53_012784 [Persea americana]|uniref:Uncharacterized protein n=1 Tax=Persea americana TaxID=3435 RepID=A0ACC2LYF8_PERAE|nr:hypothetical protein MRB53_012784 [Persea americana]